MVAAVLKWVLMDVWGHTRQPKSAAHPVYSPRPWEGHQHTRMSWEQSRWFLQESCPPVRSHGAHRHGVRRGVPFQATRGVRRELRCAWAWLSSRGSQSCLTWGAAVLLRYLGDKCPRVSTHRLSPQTRNRRGGSGPGSPAPGSSPRSGQERRPRRPCRNPPPRCTDGPHRS